MADSQELISFIAQMTGESNLRVEENLGEGYVRLRVSEAERRQAKHDIQHVEDMVIELLRNARDAGAQHIYVATYRDDDLRKVVVIDDGCGVPEDMQDRIFEARVTSKLESMHMDRWGVHGRGMALFSIRQNCDEARVITSGTNLGTALYACADTSVLPERADQSSWPVVEKDDQGRHVCARGPHNIVRTVAEFALEELHGCEVYLGSATEIAATLYQHAHRALDASQLLFLDSEEQLPVVDRLGYAADAEDFMRIACSIGLSLSERTAHRILAGTIKPMRSVAARLLRERTAAPQESAVDLARDRRGLRITRDDLQAFARTLERDFAELGDRYYLTLAQEPTVRVRGDRITVTFDIHKDE
ncbi:MAG TPA: ATP-binding protein [Candidatus Coprousia avicola]|nr:ATP-binding protein [Candidatus Coprousia avicola]